MIKNEDNNQKGICIIGGKDNGIVFQQNMSPSTTASSISYTKKDGKDFFLYENMLSTDTIPENTDNNHTPKKDSRPSHEHIENEAEKDNKENRDIKDDLINKDDKDKLVNNEKKKKKNGLSKDPIINVVPKEIPIKANRKTTKELEKIISDKESNSGCDSENSSEYTDSNDSDNSSCDSTGSDDSSSDDSSCDNYEKSKKKNYKNSDDSNVDSSSDDNESNYTSHGESDDSESNRLSHDSSGKESSLRTNHRIDEIEAAGAAYEREKIAEFERTTHQKWGASNWMSDDVTLDKNERKKKDGERNGKKYEKSVFNVDSVDEKVAVIQFRGSIDTSSDLEKDGKKNNHGYWSSDNNDGGKGQSSINNSRLRNSVTYDGDKTIRNGRSEVGSNVPHYAYGDEQSVHYSQLDVAYTDNMANFSQFNKKVTPEDFALLRVIGKGSYGKVMLVRCKNDDGVYAMKMLRKENIVKRNQVEHTRTERKVLEHISHPFIVQLYYAFQTPKKLYFILEFCPGGELFFHLSRAGRFSERRARFYAAEIVLAIEHLHKLNIVYRDLKPENVLLDEDGHVRLTDFGLSKEGIYENTSTRSLCGTPEYLAPEILCQRGHGRAVDWWSLGALLYEMLTGLPPFYTRNRDVLFQNIKEGELTYPAYISPVANSLLQGLFVRDPSKRLGGGGRDAEEIKEHLFFASIDWEGLESKSQPPPYKPALESNLDLQNFDSEFLKLPVFNSEVPDSALSVAAARDDMFQGFTFDGGNNDLTQAAINGESFIPY